MQSGEEASGRFYSNLACLESLQCWEKGDGKKMIPLWEGTLTQKSGSWLEPFAWSLFLFPFQMMPVFNDVSIKAIMTAKWKHPIEIYVQEKGKINSKIFLYSIENIQYSMIKHNGKEYKSMYMFVCMCSWIN